MIKLTFCLRRRHDLTRDQFQRYWSETHAPLVAERAAALGARRYVQVHTIDADGLHRSLQRRNGGSPEPFDGLAELWFDSVDDFMAGSASAQEAAAALLADERNFIDLAASPMFLGEEHQITGP
ncbi:MAG: EthD domain-containing protein [Acidimicrobiales bacterium]